MQHGILWIHATDEKVARTRAVIIYLTGQLLHWDDEGKIYHMDKHGDWVEWDGDV